MSAFSSKSHQTALIVDGNAYDEGGSYAERVNRLVQSLNGSNIKTDIYSVRGGSASSGVVFHGTGQPSAGGDSTVTDLDSVVAQAKEAGYNLVLAAS